MTQTHTHIKLPTRRFATATNTLDFRAKVLHVFKISWWMWSSYSWLNWKLNFRCTWCKSGYYACHVFNENLSYTSAAHQIRCSTKKYDNCRKNAFSFNIIATWLYRCCHILSYHYYADFRAFETYQYSTVETSNVVKNDLENFKQTSTRNEFEAANKWKQQKNQPQTLKRHTIIYSSHFAIIGCFVCLSGSCRSFSSR